jgi:transcriptional regulator with XRE-family HTH domain
MALIEYVGGRIRDLRQSYGAGEGISQEALAKALDIAANTVSRWETGTYRPSLEDLENLSRFFGISVLEFFPKESVPTNDKVTALLRAATQLSEDDLEELRKYAEFRRARSLYPGGAKPRAGRKRREDA